MTCRRISLSLDGLEASLLATMRAIAPAGLHLGCRANRAGDEDLLLSSERRALKTRSPHARRASGAARHTARALLAEFGYPVGPIGRERSGQPAWPTGVVGSLAHDDEISVAAVTADARITSVGIDVEPAEPLPAELTALVVTERDVPGPASHELAGRLFFAAKEACYKAAHPLDGIILAHDDIAVNLATSRALTRSGHTADLYWCSSPRIVVLAVIWTEKD